ncbi:uncharacterized protein LOC116178613 isoform X2 [Photinus pyralis]|uniref:uncharacterized protein LOC116178613 isoform X2 n=1 Tax=Photinus pyralis TaxID=7054 RepID=UPI001266EB38|nr:uncharacterized protein LOC116178613 isoform X2 [Photinus pyralis]
MSTDEEMVMLAAASFIFINEEEKKKEQKTKKSRRWWVTHIFKQRNRLGGTKLLRSMQLEEATGQFKNFVRMSAEDFELLLNEVGPIIAKQETKFRKSITPTERLALTLRFLATGDSYTSLQYLFKISKQAISCIIPEVCAALIEALKSYVQLPKTDNEWRRVSERFEKSWGFPNCLGSMDGKHIVLQSPINSGSDYFNYKSFFSIVLFALVDADYQFMFVDVGCQGRISDGGVFKHSKLHKLLHTNSSNFPEDKSLPGRDKLIPYVIVGDDAFPLTERIMKPFSAEPAG